MLRARYWAPFLLRGSPLVGLVCVSACGGPPDHLEPLPLEFLGSIAGSDADDLWSTSSGVVYHRADDDWEAVGSTDALASVLPDPLGDGTAYVLNAGKIAHVGPFGPIDDIPLPVETVTNVSLAVFEGKLHFGQAGWGDTPSYFGRWSGTEWESLDLSDAGVTDLRTIGPSLWGNVGGADGGASGPASFDSVTWTVTPLEGYVPLPDVTHIAAGLDVALVHSPGSPGSNPGELVILDEGAWRNAPIVPPDEWTAYPDVIWRMVRAIRTNSGEIGIVGYRSARDDGTETLGEIVLWTYDRATGVVSPSQHLATAFECSNDCVTGQVSDFTATELDDGSVAFIALTFDPTYPQVWIGKP